MNLLHRPYPCANWKHLVFPNRSKLSAKRQNQKCTKPALNRSGDFQIFVYYCVLLFVEISLASTTSVANEVVTCQLISETEDLPKPFSNLYHSYILSHNSSDFLNGLFKCSQFSYLCDLPKINIELLNTVAFRDCLEVTVGKTLPGKLSFPRD